MLWNNEISGGKGPWGSNGNGGGQGPWSGGSGRGSGGGGPQGPNFEDMIRRGQNKMKGVLPGGLGSPRGIGLIALIAILIWMLTGIYQIKPQESGVVLVFGKVTDITGQGLHWNWPSPIGEVEKPNVTRQRVTTAGYRDIRGGQTKITQESEMLTGDENIIDVRVAVYWKIDLRPKVAKVDGKDVTSTPGIRNFLFNIRNPQKTVKDATESALREIVGKNEFESIRTTGRGKIEAEATKLIQQIVDRYGAGVHIQRVQLLGIDPPSSVLDEFRDVQAARADKEKTINEAQAYKNRILQQAQGEAERLVRAAEAFKQERVAIARGDASRFNAIFKEYNAAKEITRTRIYIETMRDVLKDMDKILIDGKRGSGVVPYLPLNELMKKRPGTTGGSSSGGRTPTPPSGSGATSSSSASTGGR
jgi:modulator of FtsH protease HflK